ncbi:unnamed protein product [Oreochromis niloticus]|nr:unnamed protein product [Mustela putorius furo]
MNHLVKLPLLASRAFSSSARQLKNKVPESQKIFQADNGLPVHIKGGTGDVLLYRATMTLTIAGEERCSRNLLLSVLALHRLIPSEEGVDEEEEEEDKSLWLGLTLIYVVCNSA